MISITPIKMDYDGFQNGIGRSFRAASDTSVKKNPNTNTNPISRKGETAKLINATFVAGLIIGGRILWALLEDGSDIYEDLFDRFSRKNAKSMAEAAKTTKGKIINILKTTGTVAAILAGFVGVFALGYTIFKTPNIAYNSKINTFKKKKEMDVYLQGNQAEKELYTQLAEKAKNAETNREKAELQKAYMQLSVAKNEVPEFVKFRNNKQRYR